MSCAVDVVLLACYFVYCALTLCIRRIFTNEYLNMFYIAVLLREAARALQKAIENTTVPSKLGAKPVLTHTTLVHPELPPAWLIQRQRTYSPRQMEENIHPSTCAVIV